MKRKFKKIPIIILLIAGIILSSTAVFALGSGIADFPVVQEPQDNGSGESTTPPMLHDGQDDSNKKENTGEQNNPNMPVETPTENPTPTGEETSKNGDENDVGTQEPTTNPEEPKTGEENSNPGDENTSTPQPEKTITPEPENTSTPEPENTSTPEPENTNIPEPAESEEPKDSNTGDIDTSTQEPTDDKVIDESTGDDIAVEPTDDAIDDVTEESKPSASPTNGNNTNKKDNVKLKEIEVKTKDVETVVQTPDSTVAIQQKGNVNVLVVDDTYTGVMGASVSISAGRTVTNAAGYGTITAPAGSYIYTVTAPGYRASTGTVTIVPNQTTSITIVIIPVKFGVNEPGKFNASFIILNQLDQLQAVSGATVKSADFSAVSNDRGVAVLTGLLPGEYKVQIGGPNYYEMGITVMISDADVTELVNLTPIPAPPAQPNTPQSPAPQPPAPQPTQPPASTYRPSNPNNGNGGSSSNSGNNSQTVTLNKIKENGSNKQDGVDVEIIESGSLTVEPSATPSPQPTKTPAPTPKPTPSADATTYTVSFNLTNLNGSSIAGKTVELHSDVMTAKTDAQGFVTFEKVPAGEHNLYILDTNGEVESTKAFSINSGVETELDLANVGGDKVYVGMGTDAVTIDAVVDGSLMALTQVTSGTNPKAAPVTNLDQPTKEDNNLMWMLIISVSAAAIAIIILLMAIRKMKKAKSVDVHANGSAAISVDDKDVKGKLKK